jgi:hypothetical protein
MDTTHDEIDTRHPSQHIALAVGAAFALAGIAGFFVTGFDDFAHHDTGETLLGFEVNPLHNIVHLVIDAAGLLMWRRLDLARTFGWLLFIGYGATFVYGQVIDKSDEANFLSLNAADDGLHLVSALTGLAAAVWPVRHRSTAGRSSTSPARG